MILVNSLTELLWRLYLVYSTLALKKGTGIAVYTVKRCSDEKPSQHTGEIRPKATVSDGGGGISNILKETNLSRITSYK